MAITIWRWGLCIAALCIFAPRPVEAEEQRSQLGRSFLFDKVAPRWFRNSEEFWYKIKLPNGSYEFYLVDPEKGTRGLAFDPEIVDSFLAKASSGGTGEKIERLARDSVSGQLLLLSRVAVYSWNSDSKTISQDPRNPREFRETESGNDTNPQSGEETSILFDNQTDEPIEIFWLQGERQRKSYGFIGPGESKEQHTFGGHRWSVVGKNDRTIRRVTANDNGLLVIVETQESEIQPARERLSTRSSSVSPDGKWESAIRDGALWCIGLSGQSDVELEPAVVGYTFASMAWSENPQRLIAFRQKQIEKKPIHILRSSPPGGGRATLESIPYSLPGDPFPTYELRIYNPDSVQESDAGGNSDAEKPQRLIPKVDLFEHEWNQPRIEWMNDGASFCYELIDRGHQRYRLVCVSAETGETKFLIDEKSQTFIWSAHTEARDLPKTRWLTNRREVLYTSEVNGWRQLFLVDVQSVGPGGNAATRELTPRGIVLRSIDRIDEENRMVWFSASGRNAPTEDPYHLHFGRVSLDSGEVTWITEGNGTHSLVYSPSRKYVLDMYSRVDLPPVTEVRDVVNGERIIDLESTDIEAWKNSGGVTEEVFVAKGRDGLTDIWGIICRPTSMVPGKKYPVIEDIYAGPHGSFVPKNFSPSKRYKNLTDQGFIVVKIDGMGTANRSKAFQDVCWQNLRDGGFEDRIRWIKAAAEKYSEFDLDRVGIYGVSAGGQNAAAAVLFHGDFYKVAVAGCGCHDNRMDKASWNEQWMGYPVGDHYLRSSNIENAHLLRGKLLLIVGEVDTNVPPESTLRFAEALIRHNKDFDLLVVPNEGHGIGGAYGERRMQQYFVEHLKP